MARKKQVQKFQRLPYDDNAARWLGWLAGGQKGPEPPLFDKVPGDRKKGG